MTKQRICFLPSCVSLIEQNHQKPIQIVQTIWVDSRTERQKRTLRGSYLHADFVFMKISYLSECKWIWKMTLDSLAFYPHSLSRVALGDRRRSSQANKQCKVNVKCQGGKFNFCGDSPSKLEANGVLQHFAARIIILASFFYEFFIVGIIFIFLFLALLKRAVWRIISLLHQAMITSWFSCF